MKKLVLVKYVVINGKYEIKASFEKDTLYSDMLKVADLYNELYKDTYHLVQPIYEILGV